jgi:hypothetical protein
MKITFLHEQVATAIAMGDKTQEEIAAYYGKDVSTLQRWNRDSYFIALVATVKATLWETILANAREEGIAIVEERIIHLNKRHKGLTSIIETRSQKWKREKEVWDKSQHEVNRQKNPLGFTPEDEGQGLETGLVVRKRKKTAFGDNIEWAVDTGLLKSLRDIESEVADQLGQKQSKIEVTGASGGPIEIQVSAPGYRLGNAADAMRWIWRLAEAGRDMSDVDTILAEVIDRETAARLGEAVPPLSEPFRRAIPAA